MRKKDKEEDKPAPTTIVDESRERTPPTRSNSLFWGIGKKPLVEEPCGDEQFEVVSRPSMRDRAATVDASSSPSFWPNRRPSVASLKDEQKTPERPGHQKSKSTTAVVTQSKSTPAVVTTTSQGDTSKPPVPSKSQTVDGSEVGEYLILMPNDRLLIKFPQLLQQSPMRQCGC